MTDDFGGLMSDDDWWESDYFDEEDYRSIHGASNVGDFSWGGQDMWNTSAAQSDSMHGLLGGGGDYYDDVKGNFFPDEIEFIRGQRDNIIKGIPTLDHRNPLVTDSLTKFKNDVRPNTNTETSLTESLEKAYDKTVGPLITGQHGAIPTIANIGEDTFKAIPAAYARGAGGLVKFGKTLGNVASGTEFFDENNPEFHQPKMNYNYPGYGKTAEVMGSYLGGATGGVKLAQNLPHLAKYGSAILGGTATTDPTEGNLSTWLQGTDYANSLTDALDSKVSADASSLDKLGAYGKNFLEEGLLSGPLDFGINLYMNPELRKTTADAAVDLFNPNRMDNFFDKTPGLLAEPKKDIIGYHGTKYDLANNKFDINKVGKGQGKATYGHGIYIAQNPKVAGVYQAELSGDKMYDTLQTKDGTSIADYMNKEPVSDHALHVYFKHQGDLGKTISELKDKAANSSLTSLRNLSKKGIPFIEDFVKTEKPTWKGTGKLYEVDVPDIHIANMLNHDTTLATQPQHIQHIANKRGLDLNITGNTLYRHLTGELGSKKAASEFLNDNGIKGIKYLDGDSRNSKFVLSPPDEVKTGDWMVKDNMRPNSEGKHFATKKEAETFLETAKKGTSNFVVFDDSILTVLRKNDEYVGRKPMVPTHAMNDDSFLKQAEAGGFTNPGFAISSVDKSLSNLYGKNYLIADRTTIDPSKSGTRAYGTDAFTGRQPDTWKAYENPKELFDALTDAEKRFYEIKTPGHLKPGRVESRMGAIDDYANVRSKKAPYGYDKNNYLTFREMQNHANRNGDYIDLKLTGRDDYFAPTIYMMKDKDGNVVKYNIKDVAAYMKKENSTAAGTEREMQGKPYVTGSGVNQALASKEYKTLEDITKDRDRLLSSNRTPPGVINNAVFDLEFDKAVEIIKNIDRANWDAGRTSILNTNNPIMFENVITDALRGKDLKDNLITKHFKDSDLQVVNSLVNKLKGIAQKQSTNYFESKVGRVVGLDEIPAALIPKGGPAEIEKYLRDAGVKVLKYGSEAEKMELLKTVPKHFFSAAPIGLMGLAASDDADADFALVTNLGSVHPGSDYPYNENNFGIGLQYTTDDNWVFGGQRLGANSLGDPSNQFYVEKRFQPFEYGGAGVGGIVSDGYDKSPLTDNGILASPYYSGYIGDPEGVEAYIKSNYGIAEPLGADSTAGFGLMYNF